MPLTTEEDLRPEGVATATARWRHVGHGYYVSDDGNLWSEHSKRTLSGKTLRGYRFVHVIVDGVRKWVPVHRLVAAAFVPGRTDAKWSVNHIDGNKINNHYTNLEWTDDAGQQAHATSAKLRPRGQKVATAKVTEGVALAICASNDRQKDIAKKYGISQAQVSAIRCGASWSHVTGVTRTGRCRVKRASSQEPPEELNGEIWRTVEGFSRYSVSTTGRVWSHISGRLLQTYRPNHGRYVAVNLANDDGSHSKVLVHRLVATAFVPGRTDVKWSVNHIDRNTMNNHSSNLEWTDNAGQQAHKTVTVRYVRHLAVDAGE